MIIAVVGLDREARIVQGPGIAVSRRGAGLPNLLAQGAEGVISIGIAAGLDPSLKVGDCVIASHIIADDRRFEVDEHWRETMNMRLSSEAGAGRKCVRVGVIASRDAALASTKEKHALFAQTSAVAADMESHIAAQAAAAASVPFGALRVISDEAGDSLPPAAIVAMRADGSIDMGAIVGSLLAKPTQIPALMRTARSAEIAFKALLRCRSALGPRLACPDFG